MRVDTVSSSILLVFLLNTPFDVNGQESSTTGVKGPNPTETVPKIIVTKPTVPPKPTPTTPTPIETTTFNPNITYIDKIKKESFIESCNRQREKHLLGRNAFSLTWDESLVESAISRITESCEVDIDNSDKIHEVLLTPKEWLKVRRDPKQTHPKMLSLILKQGAARAGCVERKGCGGDKEQDSVVFCHFAPSNYSLDPDFEVGSTQCERDKSFTGLCIDAPLIPTTTEPRIRVVYVKMAPNVGVWMTLIWMGIRAVM